MAASLPSLPPAAAQAALSGRVIGSARGQVAWLDLLAPRPTPVTQLVRPAYPADVAASPGVPFAVASVVSTFANSNTNTSAPPIGADLTLIDVDSSSSRTLLSRQSDAESLDLPAIWPDGSGILYQRSNLHAAIAMPGQAQPQFMSRVEQTDAEGQTVVPLLEDARYPGPSPDGTRFAFVRSTSAGAGIFVHAMGDGSDAPLVSAGRFLALAYPRFSPDGQQVAFVAIPLASPIGERPLGLASWLSPAVALAHGFPWEAWIVNADGTNMRQIQDVVDDDPSVSWSPDGSQLLIYGGWGSFVVDAATGSATSLSYIAGYGSVGWLPD